MKKITKIGAGSLAKLSGACYATMGFIFGLFFLVLGLVGAAVQPQHGLASLMFGIFSPIVLAIFYGIMGIVFGYLSALIYNFFAKYVGGVEFDVE